MLMEKRHVHVVVLLTVIAMLFTMVIPSVGDTVSADGADLTVIVEGETPVEFSRTSIQAIQNDEGNTSYNYSFYNHRGNPSTAGGIQGASVLGILEAAKVTIDDDDVISFESSEDVPYIVKLTGKQLKEDRYYYPNFELGTSTGKAGSVDSRVGAVKTPTIISIGSQAKNCRLYVGQVEPNEQNNPLVNKFMLNGATIRIEKNAADSAPAPSYSISDSQAAFGSNIGINYSLGEVYYTTDKTKPSLKNDIYNYDTNSEPNKTRTITTPLKSENKDTFTIRTMVMEYGYMDSYASKTYSLVLPVAAGVKATAPDYKSINVTWVGNADADGYIIYKSTAQNGSFAEVATITNNKTTSYTDTNVKTGTSYFYKVVPFHKDGTENIEGLVATTVSAKPELKTPASAKAKAGKKKITVTAKKVDGQDGYVVYRATKKNGKYKAIKTIKTKKNLKFTNKKLKSKKTYYYKVKAYKVVDGKKVMSAYSKRVSKKAK